MPEQPRHYTAARSSFDGEIKAAGRDLANSFEQSRLWYALGLNDIVSKYRGSVLGPFWITITTSIFVAGIGFVYAELMHVSTEKYLPWLATGSVIWGLISQTILESTDAFIVASHVLRQTAVPLPLFIWRVIWRNLLIFAHQTPVIIGVALLFHYVTQINILMALVGMVLLVVNVAWIALSAAILAARFRDLQQVMASIMQLMFFITPVMWIPTQSKSFAHIANFNPAAHLLGAVRNPLLGLPVSSESLMLLAAMACGGWILSFLFFAYVRRRVVHYV